jgi:hypothetical protein
VHDADQHRSGLDRSAYGVGIDETSTYGTIASRTAGAIGVVALWSR